MIQGNRFTLVRGLGRWSSVSIVVGTRRPQFEISGGFSRSYEQNAVFALTRTFEELLPYLFFPPGFSMDWRSLP
jgi:hypothetical protein